MFGKTLFNKTLFNRTTNANNNIYATVKTEYGLEVPQLKVRAKLFPVTIGQIFNLDLGRLWVKIPIKGLTIKSEYAVKAGLSSKVPLMGTGMHQVYELLPGSIRIDNSEEFSLEGINLKPGQQLIIDTDMLEVEVDGEPDVDAWVSGSTFFQLKPGKNILRVYDNVYQRSLNVTVLWEDRYL